MIARTRWDPLRLAVGAVLFTHVWRLQDLEPAVDAAKPLLLATAAALGLALLTPGSVVLLRRRWRHPAVPMVLGILLLGALSVPGSLWPGASFGFLLHNLLAAVLVFLLLVATIRDDLDVGRYVAVQLAGALVYSVTILTRYDVGPGGRLGSLVYYDANDLGMLLDCILPFAIHFMWRARTLLGRLAGAAAVGVFIIGIVRTGSRGAFIGLVGVGIYTVWRGRHLPLRLRLGGVAVAVSLLMLFGSSQYWTMMRTLLDPSDDYNWVGQSEGGRMEIWRRGLGYMLTHPAFGVGLAAFPVAEGTISPLAERQEFSNGVKWSAAHSSYVQIGAELGIGGLLLFLGILVVTFRRLTAPSGRGSAYAHPLAAALIGYALAGAFLSQAYAPFLFSMLGIAVGAAQLPDPFASPARAPAFIRHGHAATRIA